MTPDVLTLGALALDGPGPVVLASLFAATMVQEDAAVVGAGVLAAQGIVDPLAALSAVTAGIALGDCAIHLAGRYAGDRRWMQRRMRHARVTRATDWLRQRWWQALLAARFVPGTRVATCLASGVLKTPLAGSLAIIALGSLVWVPLLFLASLFGGEQLAGLFARNVLLAMLVLACGLALAGVARHLLRRIPV